MDALHATAGSSKRGSAWAGALLAAAGGTLALWAAFAPALWADGGSSSTLAELAARSPGARLGGVALKAKPKRAAALASVKAAAAPGPGLGSPLGADTPLGQAAATGSPLVLGSSPSLFGPVTDDVATPGLAVAADTPASTGGFAFVSLPDNGVIIGSGGGTSGGGTETPSSTTSPSPTPTATSSPTPTVTSPAPTVAAVPEPATWLTLIVGFGFVGGILRSRRRVRRLA